MVKKEFWQSRYAAYALNLSIIVIFLVSIIVTKRKVGAELVKTQSQLKVKELQISESRRENVQLQRDLNLKIDEISALKNTISDSNEFLEKQSFRDLVTGLIRYDNYLKLMNAGEPKNEGKQFNFIYIIELENYEVVCNTYNGIIGSELRAGFSDNIKSELFAENQICIDKQNRIVVFGMENDKILGTALEIKQKLDRLFVSVANDVKLNIQSSLSVLSLENIDDKLESELNACVSLISTLHAGNKTIGANEVLFVNLNTTLPSDVIESLKSDSPLIEQIISDGTIKISYEI